MLWRVQINNRMMTKIKFSPQVADFLYLHIVWSIDLQQT